jgi:hypothetical protein
MLTTINIISKKLMWNQNNKFTKNEGSKMQGH